MHSALSVFCILLGLSHSQIYFPESNQDFNSLIQDNQYVLTLFRKGTQECPECDRVATELAEVSNYIDNKEIALASVNCAITRELCEPFNVPYNYPCLKFFDSTTVIDYYGNYDRDAIISNVQRLTGPILTELKTCNALDSFVERFNDSIIMFMKPDDKGPLADFAAAATHLRANVTFAYASIDLLNESDVEIDSDISPVILLYTTLRSHPVQYLEKELSVTLLEHFIGEERFPVFNKITPETYLVYIDRGLPLVWCFLAADDERPHYLKLLKSVALKSRKHLSWVWLEAEKHSRHAANFDLTFTWPAIVVDDVVSKTKYIYPHQDPFEEDNISEWIIKVLAKEVRANVKTEKPFPDSDTSKPLIRAVGENFSQIISEPSKDIFVIITSKSWCGACKVVDPQILTLAEIFKDEPSVLIVEIDGSWNDVPLDFNEFPSIFFFPAGRSSNSTLYRGPYTYAAMADYILRNSQSLAEDQHKSVKNQVGRLLDLSKPTPNFPSLEKTVVERDEL